MSVIDHLLSTALAVGAFALVLLVWRRRDPSGSTSLIWRAALSAVVVLGGVLVLLDGTFSQFAVGVLVVIVVAVGVTAATSAWRKRS